jgi:hypothetical protein
VQELAAGEVPLEQDLEDWIEATPSMLGDGWTIVGRQLRTDGGKLDLLAIDQADRWVVVELKRGRLYRDAIAQGLDYAACLRSSGAEAVRAILATGRPLRNDEAARRRIADVLDGEGEDVTLREVAITVVGVGLDAGVDRVISLLAHYRVPVSAMSFTCLSSGDARRILVREVVEAEVPMRPTRPESAAEAASLQDVQSRADAFGVGEPFRRLIEAVEAAGLFPRAYKRSVMVAPPTNHTRYLMVATPKGGGRIRLNHSPQGLRQFFPHLSESDIESRLGPGVERSPAGPDLDAEVDRIVAFLTWFASLSDREVSGG